MTIATQTRGRVSTKLGIKIGSKHFKKKHTSEPGAVISAVISRCILTPFRSHCHPDLSILCEGSRISPNLSISAVRHLLTLGVPFVNPTGGRYWDKVVVLWTNRSDTGPWVAICFVCWKSKYWGELDQETGSNKTLHHSPIINRICQK